MQEESKNYIMERNKSWTTKEKCFCLAKVLRTSQVEKMEWASCNLLRDPGKEFLSGIRCIQTVRKVEEQKSCFGFAMMPPYPWSIGNAAASSRLDTGPQWMELSCYKYPHLWCLLVHSHCVRSKASCSSSTSQVLHFSLLLAEPPLYSAIATAFLPNQPRVGRT